MFDDIIDFLAAGILAVGITGIAIRKGMVGIVTENTTIGAEGAATEVALDNVPTISACPVWCIILLLLFLCGLPSLWYWSAWNRWRKRGGELKM
jgi:hypothetical protein